MSGSESNPTRSRPGKREDLAKLLELRTQIKVRTPYFRRFESWRFVRLDEPWRKPKGVDNHERLSVKGWPHLVKIGYRVPKAVRYLHPSGYRDILVHNLKELEVLSPDTDAARIAAGVGRRKRIDIATRAKELGIRVLNGRSLLTIKSESEEQTDEKKDESKKGKKKK
jgi:large subunit ribosomal protein L32e